MRPVRFFVLSTLGRLPGIVASAFIGSAAIHGDWVSAIVITAIVGGLGILGIVFNAQIMAIIGRVQKCFGHRRDE
jgi:uncharacterized membrane protein YdjX (TVP38/TMEM64 family)